MLSPFHLQSAPLYFLMVIHSLELWRKSKASVWIIGGVLSQGKEGMLASSFQCSYFLIVLLLMKSWQCLNIPWRTATGIEETAQSTPTHHFQIQHYAGIWQLPGTITRQREDNRNTNTDAYRIYIKPLRKIQWKQHPRCCWFSEVNLSLFTWAVIFTLNI